MSIFYILYTVIALCNKQSTSVIGQRLSSTMSSSDFPSTLKEFGYGFNGNY